MWKWGQTLNYVTNSSKVKFLDFWPPMVQDGCQKKANIIFSLPDTINFNKKHVGKNYAKNPTKVHKGVYYHAQKRDLGNFHVKMKWNDSGFRPLLCTYRLNWARWVRWHCGSPDIGFEIRALAVWGRVRGCSVGISHPQTIGFVQDVGSRCRFNKHKYLDCKL